tara:strand:- start:5 stop:460 length:456 start_codon:yes stop_codon:yes gene_type:complete
MAKQVNTRNGSILNWSAETWAFMSLRLFLSLRFITAGLGKFSGEEGYSFSNYYEGTAKGLLAAFQSTFIPQILLVPYVYSIAYVQIILGVLLVLGVKTKYVLALFALTFVSLAFGKMCLSDHQTVTSIGIHLLITCAALYFVRHNKFELKR